jgi:[ribosomal protein S18]-alanine N-acetyltransferase
LNQSNKESIIWAEKEDFSEIAAFLGSAAVVHRHLDWQNTLEWLGGQPFLLLKDRNGIQAILVLCPDPPRTAWVHCFAVADAARLENSWKMLFATALPHLQARAATPFAVSLQGWFFNLLSANGFTKSQDIVGLIWDHHINPAPALPESLSIRPMLESDLDEVANVDALSFEQQWVVSRPALQMAYLQAQHTSVAESNGRIIGYELTTANQYTAHLARLAVLPEFRRSGIAKHLVNEMLRYFSARGVMQLTVNTQSDNEASLQLYWKLGFTPTGETYPVLTFQ